jgi:N-methylhydantoinase A
MKHPLVVGADVGGTFTDIVAIEPDTGQIAAAFKLPTTPDNPADAILAGLDRLGAVGRVLHGATVGTNALIQKRGARTGLITTKGFRDVLELRRQARPRLYDLRPQVSPPLVERVLRHEADERMGYNGKPLRPLDSASLERAIDALEAAGVEAVVVAFLHSYANDAHERQAAEAVRRRLPGVFVTISSDVVREYREFERISTAVVNAYVGPPVRRYLEDLRGRLESRGVGAFGVVKSNGGLASAESAARQPVHLIESGPAAGVVAAAAFGAAENEPNVIAFDMGGTTAKVGVVQDGAARLTTEFYADRLVDGFDLGGYPIRSPVIDIVEIGAGGGSIARVDAAGVIKVGPQSAGAEPGPACYGRGGDLPTVTDAHAVIGMLDVASFAESGVALDLEAARAAIEKHVARPLGWNPVRAAHAILALANANMVEMVRLATLRRGLDPRDFALAAYGGAGPLHAAEVAREVGVPRALVPREPGLFSALGALLSEVRHDMVQTVLVEPKNMSPDDFARVFGELEARMRAALEADAALTDGVAPRLVRALDLRFRGQLFELTLALEDGAVDGGEVERRFRSLYRDTYGYDLPAASPEIVNARLAASVAVSRHGLPRAGAGRGGGRPSRHALVAPDGSRIEIDVWRRVDLPAGEPLRGPLLVRDDGSTIRVLAGQRLTARPSGVLAIEEEGGR